MARRREGVHRRARRRDEGLVAGGIVVAVAIGIVALIFVAIIPLLSGTEQSSRTQTSADAAALAGAQDVRQAVLDRLDTAVLPSGGLFGTAIASNNGYGAAQTYAAANAADLVEYGYDASTDEVRVRTRLRQEAPGGDHAETFATASLGVKLRACDFSDAQVVVGYEPVPTPTPSPDPTPGETPTPEPSPTPTTPPVPIYGHEYRITCSGSPHFDTGARSEVAAVLGSFHDWLDHELEPHLVR